MEFKDDILNLIEESYIVIDSGGLIIDYNQNLIDLLMIQEDLINIDISKTYLSDFYIKIRSELKSKKLINYDIKLSKDIFETIFIRGKASKLNKYNNEYIIITINSSKREIYYQQELMKLKELSNAGLKVKDEFLSNVGHELKTPINCIIGFLELLYLKENDEENIEYINTIKNATNELLVSINNILIFSDIEFGRYNLNKERIILHLEIENIKNMYKEKAFKKGLDFIYEYDDNLNEYIDIEIESVIKVLTNLLSNAVKFTNEGYIKLMVNKKDENFIEFIIEDSGIGMDENEKSNIFTPFEQGEYFLSKKYEGLGIGMSIVERIIYLIDGNIKIESINNLGTKISICVPYK